MAIEFLGIMRRRVPVGADLGDLDIELKVAMRMAYTVGLGRFNEL
jgi:hypothetical protein